MEKRCIRMFSLPTPPSNVILPSGFNSLACCSADPQDLIQHIPVQLWPMDVSLTDITRPYSSRFGRLI